MSAFTLIEVIISAALMAMIIVSAFLCFNASVASQKDMEPRLEVIQNARVAMALMTADLRAACPLDKESQFLGMHRMMGDAVADNLDFATHNYTPQHQREGDFCQLSYYLNPDPETGRLSLWRRRNPTIALDALTGGQKAEIATGVAGLRFEYYDGLDWYETWGDPEGRGKPQTSRRAETQPNLTGMPEAVRITIWFDASPQKKTAAPSDDEKREPPLAFQTIARLNLATVSTGSSSGATATDTSGQATEGQGTGGEN